MSPDQKFRIFLLLGGFIFILLIIGALMNSVNRAKAGSGTSFLGLVDESGFKSKGNVPWLIFGIVAIFVVFFLGYFVLYFGGKSYIR